MTPYQMIVPLPLPPSPRKKTWQKRCRLLRRWRRSTGVVAAVGAADGRNAEGGGERILRRRNSTRSGIGAADDGDRTWTRIGIFHILLKGKGEEES